MISFALVGLKKDVLDAFNKATGSEKKDAEFLPAIQKAVADEVAKQHPDYEGSIGLEVKARPTAADKLGLTIFTHKF
jgi:hypothetical protein